MRGKGFEKESGGVDPSFFDLNEDVTGNVPHQWSLEVGDVETEVTDNFSFDAGYSRSLLFSSDSHLQICQLSRASGKALLRGLRCAAAARRVTFVSSDGIWALRFGDNAAYQRFADAYREKLFENTFKVENDESNRAKVRC